LAHSVLPSLSKANFRRSPTGLCERSTRKEVAAARKARLKARQGTRLNARLSAAISASNACRAAICERDEAAAILASWWSSSELS
jgi:hypothetical protein